MTPVICYITGLVAVSSSESLSFGSKEKQCHWLWLLMAPHAQDTTTRSRRCAEINITNGTLHSRGKCIITTIICIVGYSNFNFCYNLPRLLLFVLSVSQSIVYPSPLSLSSYYCSYSPTPLASPATPLTLLPLSTTSSLPLSSLSCSPSLRPYLLPLFTAQLSPHSCYPTLPTLLLPTAAPLPLQHSQHG